MTFIGLHFDLQLVHQVLQSNVGFLVFISLKEVTFQSTKTLYEQNKATRRLKVSVYLVALLFDLPLVFTDSLDGLTRALLLSFQFSLQLTYLI